MTEKKWKPEKLGALTLKELESLVGLSNAIPSPFHSKPLARIYVADSDLEGQYLVDALEQEGIPAMYRSYRDTAYDGLFTQTLGAGVIVTTQEMAQPALEIVESVVEAFRKVETDISGNDEG